MARWPYPAYPPYYWPAPGYIAAGVIATGLAFGAGYALGRWASGGNYWGGSVNWNNNSININRPTNGGGGNNWKPRVDHRQGAGNRGDRQQGLDFRGNRGQQVLNPGGNRGGNRPSAGGGTSAVVAEIARTLVAVINGQAQEHVRQGLTAVTMRPRVQVAEQRTAALITQAALSAEGAPIALLPRSIAGAEALLTPELAAACEPAEAEPVTAQAVAVALIEAVEAARAVVAGDGVPISASSTTSSCSAISITVLAFIASATTAVIRLTSASWPKRCNSLIPKRSSKAGMAICGSITTSLVCPSRATTNGSDREEKFPHGRKH